MLNLKYSFTDQLTIQFDSLLSTLIGKNIPFTRENPARALPEPSLTEQEKRQVAGLLRVNHAGEICAQALYQGQALTARNPDITAQLQQSAIEENDHLLWCQERLTELNSHCSYLSIVWYCASFVIGVSAGLVGDAFNLGFLAETEKQVAEHLQRHVDQLPKQDAKTLAILQQMHEDETRHATLAIQQGAADLPRFIKRLMTLSSRVMTTLAYWI